MGGLLALAGEGGGGPESEALVDDEDDVDTGTVRERKSRVAAEDE